MSESFEDTAARLSALREVDDGSRWAAGDIVAEYIGRNRSDTDTATTIASLAAHSGFERGGLRERYHCSAFYPADLRRWDNTVSWSHYNRARRGVDIETACDHLEWADKRTVSVAHFERVLTRWKQLKGMLASGQDLPEQWRTLAVKLRGQAKGDFMAQAVRAHLLNAAVELERSALAMNP